MPDISHCCESLNHPIVVVTEKGRTARILNPELQQITRVKVDGCVITNGVRADWIIASVDGSAVIIELKGANVEHAYKQLLATAQNGSCRSLLKGKRAMLIVCSKAPSFDTQRQKFELEARRLGFKLRVKSGFFEGPLSQLL